MGDLPPPATREREWTDERAFKAPASISKALLYNTTHAPRVPIAESRLLGLVTGPVFPEKRPTPSRAEHGCCCTSETRRTRNRDERAPFKSLRVLFNLIKCLWQASSASSRKLLPWTRPGRVFPRNLALRAEGKMWLRRASNDNRTTR